MVTKERAGPGAIRPLRAGFAPRSLAGPAHRRGFGGPADFQDRLGGSTVADRLGAEPRHLPLTCHWLVRKQHQSFGRPLHLRLEASVLTVAANLTDKATRPARGATDAKTLT